MKESFPKSMRDFKPASQEQAEQYVAKFFHVSIEEVRRVLMLWEETKKKLAAEKHVINTVDGMKKKLEYLHNCKDCRRERREKESVTIPRKHVNAVKRVLKLVDGYMSTQFQAELLGFDGGMMTWKELRQQLNAARKLLK